MATKKINFDIESREDEEDRITISINGIGEVVLTETFPEYEFLEDVGEDGLEELNVEEGDLIGKIEHLEINDEYKGQGYAKLLMNKAIELAKEKGLMPLYLNASPMGSKRYGLDVDDLTGFYESLGFEVFLRQGGNNLMILKDTYKTGGETKNKIMAKQMKIQYAENYSKGGVTFSEWSKDDFFQEQFNEWMEDGNVIKFEDGYSTQDAQYRNRLKNMSDLKRYFYKEFIKGQYNSYAGGGSTDDKHLIAKAIEYITGYAVDTDSIVKKGFTYNFTYKGRNVSSSLDSKLIDDTIRMNKKSMASRYAESSATKYAEGGGVKVDGLTKQEFIDAFDKRVENIIENLKQKGEYDSEDFDLYGEADKQGGLTEIEQVGSWYELADEDYNDAGALINYMLVYDFSDESNYTLNTLAHLYFGKPMKLKVFVDSIGDAEYDLYNELQKIKLLSNKIDFNKVVGVIDYEKTNDNTDLDFYKDVELVMTLKGDWNQGTDELDTTIDVNGETAELNYHPLDGMGGINFTQLEENINKAFSELNTYSAVVSIEGYEEYAEDVEGLENARATIQNIKGNTRFQVLKGSSVGIGKRVDDSRVVEEFKKGGEAGFDDAGTSLAMYHETKGNWLVPKGQVYLWLYDVENSAEKIESGEFDYVQYPLTSMSMAWQRGYIPPLKRIWTKKFQKMNKGSEHLLGVIKAFLINENGKEELYIDMMSVNPTKKKKGIMSYMIKDLRDTFNLSQDQITFSKLTPEGEKFVAKKTYEDGGGVEDYINIDKMNPDKYEVVRNFNTLKSLAKMGFIELDEKTGLRYKNYEDKMRGNRVTNVRHDYIKSAISPYFENNNKQYAIGYIKGLNFLELYVLEDITKKQYGNGGEILNRIPKTYELELDYRVGQMFKEDIVGGTADCYITSIDFQVNESNGLPVVHPDSYRIEYKNTTFGSTHQSHFSFLKNLKKEKNKIKIEVPYSIGGGIFFEDSVFDNEIKLLNGVVEAFKVMYYGTRNDWFNYYVELHGENYSIDSKDAYSSINNYISRVSTGRFIEEKLEKFKEPIGGELKIKLDYEIGQKIKIPVMGGFEESEITGIDIVINAQDGSLVKTHSRSRISYKNVWGGREDEGSIYKDFEEEHINKLENEIIVDVKALYLENYLILHRYMEGSKLDVENVRGYILKIDKNGYQLGYIDDDIEFDVFTSLNDFREKISSNDDGGGLDK
jgi:predicted GNAT family acetyltransferase